MVYSLSTDTNRAINRLITSAQLFSGNKPPDILARAPSHSRGPQNPASFRYMGKPVTYSVYRDRAIRAFDHDESSLESPNKAVSLIFQLISGCTR